MIRVLITSIFFLFSMSIFAQQDNPQTIYQQIELADSSIITGTIVFEDDNVIQIKSLNGEEARINKKNILNKKSVVVTAKAESQSDSTDIVENLFAISEVTDSTIVRIELSGGSVLIGTIVYEDSTSITLNLLSNNETTINKEMIINREIVSSNIQNGQYWREDPNSTRLFFGPTGRGLKSGEGYFSIYEIFFPMLAVGIGDHFTLAGGISLVPGSSEQIIYIAPKITFFQNDKFAASLGDFFVKFPNDSEHLNIVYTVGTVSFDKGAITAGVGYETESVKPIFLIGGELRISRYAKLITENWFIADSEFNFASLGIRFLGEHLAADFAFVVPLLSDDDVYFMPWLGFAYNF